MHRCPRNSRKVGHRCQPNHIDVPEFLLLWTSMSFVLSLAQWEHFFVFNFEMLSLAQSWDQGWQRLGATFGPSLAFKTKNEKLHPLGQAYQIGRYSPVHPSHTQFKSTSPSPPGECPLLMMMILTRLPPSIFPRSRTRIHQTPTSGPQSVSKSVDILVSNANMCTTDQRPGLDSTTSSTFRCIPIATRHAKLSVDFGLGV